jgi:hypothetical protein
MLSAAELRLIAFIGTLMVFALVASLAIVVARNQVGVAATLPDK